MICRDFLRGECQRETCRFDHIPLEEIERRFGEQEQEQEDHHRQKNLRRTSKVK